MQTTREKKIKSDIFFSILWQALKIFFLAAWVLLSAKILGAQNYGLFNGIAGIAFCLSSISSFGFTYYLIQEGAREPLKLKMLWGKSIFICFAGSFVAITILFFVDILFNLYINLSTLMLFAVSELLFAPFTTLTASALASRGLVTWAAAIPAISAFIRLIFIIFFWLSPVEKSLANYAYFHCASSAISGIFCTILMQHKTNLTLRIAIPSIYDFKKSYLFFLSHTLTNTLGGLDKYLAMKLASPELAGVYTLGLRVTSALIQPIDAAISSMLPRMFTSSTKSIPNIFYFSLVGYTILTITILIIVGNSIFIHISSDYATIGDSIILFALLIPITSLRLLISNILLTSNRVGKKLASEFIGLVCLILAGLYLIPQNGLDGIIISLLVAETGQIISGILFTITSPLLLKSQQLISKEK